MISKKKILHVLKEKADGHLLNLIRLEARSHQVSVILIQEAANITQEAEKIEISPIGGDIFVLSDDLKPGQETLYPQITYKEMLDKIFACDAVVTW